MSRRLKKSDRFTVFHATYSDKPPHEYENQQSFHAGTYDAARDRLASARLDMIIDGARPTDEEIAVPKMHAYEVRVKPSLMTFEDPHVWREGNEYEYDMRVKEEGPTGAPPKKILKYRNQFEDRNSISYVIPRHFVDQGYVKYLGDQWPKGD